MSATGGQFNYQTWMQNRIPTNQRMSVDPGKVVGSGYRFGTGGSDDPAIRMQRAQQRANANVQQFNYGNRPNWNKPSGYQHKAAEYDAYKKDRAKWDAQRSAAIAQRTHLNQTANQYGAPQSPQNRPQYATPQQALSRGLGALRPQRTSWR